MYQKNFWLPFLLFPSLLNTLSIKASFNNLPNPALENIVESLISSNSSIENTVDDIKNLTLVNKQFAQHICSPQTTSTLINKLAHVHNLHILEAAHALHTQTSKQWLENYRKQLYQKIIEKPSVHDIPDLMTFILFKATHTPSHIFVFHSFFDALCMITRKYLPSEAITWKYVENYEVEKEAIANISPRSKIIKLKINDPAHINDLQLLEDTCKNLLTTVRSNWEIKSSSAYKEINNKRLKRSGFQLNKRLLAYEANLLEMLLSIFTLKPQPSFLCYDENNNNEIEYSIEYDNKIEKILDLQIIPS